MTTWSRDIPTELPQLLHSCIMQSSQYRSLSSLREFIKKNRPEDEGDATARTLHQNPNQPTNSSSPLSQPTKQNSSSIANTVNIIQPTRASASPVVTTSVVAVGKTEVLEESMANESNLRRATSLARTIRERNAVRGLKNGILFEKLLTQRF